MYLCVLQDRQYCYFNLSCRTGGIVPHVAGQLHQENLERVTSMALERSGCGFQDITAIAVTTGPGLAPCLNAGLKFAKELAIKEKYMCIYLIVRCIFIYLPSFQQATDVCTPHGSTCTDTSTAKQVSLIHFFF